MQRAGCGHASSPGCPNPRSTFEPVLLTLLASRERVERSGKDEQPEGLEGALLRLDDEGAAEPDVDGPEVRHAELSAEAAPREPRLRAWAP